MDENTVAVVSVITIFGVLPIVIAFARYHWKRAAEPRRPDISEGASMRIAHMQQSIDAMAIELERISENQRFVTKLLAEREKVPERLREGLHERSS